MINRDLKKSKMTTGRMMSLASGKIHMENCQEKNIQIQMKI